jgi:hypothetical protein
VGAIHQFAGLHGAELDLRQAVQRGLVELLIFKEEAEVAVEQRQDIIHPVRKAAHQLILEFRVNDLHGRTMAKQWRCPAAPFFLKFLPPWPRPHR